MKLLTAPEAAKHLSLALRTFYYFVHQGRTPRGEIITLAEAVSADLILKTAWMLSLRTTWPFALQITIRF
jgi:hypothetical protein